VWCWGQTTFGQLGTGVMVADQPYPVSVGALAVSAMSAAANHTCAVVGQQVECWGNNGGGQNGLSPQLIETNTPMRVTGVSCVQ
jgi:alpha-tubulin suppressor-like RCC1 family protein